ncbi:family 43 glycosylhydrolase [Leucobacter sp. HY1908]
MAAIPLVVTALPAVATAAPANDNGYLWLHFGATDTEKIYYGYSEDGANWRKLNDNKPVIQSQVGTGGIRDPHTVRLESPDAEGNNYVMLGTDLHAEGSAPGGSWDQVNASQHLVISKSADLVSWSEPELVHAGFAEAGNVWAPEAIWDEAQNNYRVYWSARDKRDAGTPEWNLRVYETTTQDFETFTQPEVWLDESALGTDTAGNIIDTSVVQGEDGNYYRFSTSDWFTVVDTADQLAGPWKRLIERDSAVNGAGESVVPGYTGYPVTKTSASGLSTRIEGLTVFQTPAGGWLAMGDNGGYVGFEIETLASLRAGAAFKPAQTSFDQRFRHGSVLPLTEAEQTTILAAYDTSAPVTPVAPDAPGSDPIVAYDFEDAAAPTTDTTGGGNDLQLHGAPQVEKPGDWGSTALQLRTAGQYAELPQGLLDGRNEITVEFASKSRLSSGNFFSFALGADDQKYLFARLRGGEVYTGITKSSWQQERGTTGVLDTTSAWHEYSIVLTPDRLAVYADGVLLGEQTSLNATVADLGRDLKIMLGRSFYQGDRGFDGGFDDIRVFGYAKSDLEIRGIGAALQVVDTDQVLTQRSERLKDDKLRQTIVLDYWADPATGALTDKSGVQFDYLLADGATLRDESGAPITAAELAKLTDYSKPVNLTLEYLGEEVAVELRVEVLVTPVRISGDAAEASGIGRTDPTGAEGWKFFADPEIVAEDGRYYIFPTTDGYAGWAGHSIHAFVSDDLVTWKDEGVVVDLAKDSALMPDGRADRAWAPGFAKRDGKFYLYFSGNGQVNVAVSDPAKGGTISSGYEIQTVKVESSIDPAVFEDPATGKWWLTWGQGPGMYAELNEDMTSIKPDTLVRTDATKNIREASYLTAREWNGEWTYYYTYSIDDTNSPNYRVGYATASTLEGDGSQWTYRGEILVKDEAKGILGTAHQSVLQVPGTDDWYMAYHVFLTDDMRPRGFDQTHGGQQIATGNKRETRLAKMTYSEPTVEETKAGEVPLINPIAVTYAGVAPERTPVVALDADDARAGQPISAAFGEGWSGKSWQWLRDGKPISGATKQSYTPTTQDVGRQLSARLVGESTTGVTGNDTKSASRTHPLETTSLRVAPASESNAGADDGGNGSEGTTTPGTKPGTKPGTGTEATGVGSQAGGAGSADAAKQGLAETGSGALPGVLALGALLAVAGIAVMGVRARRRAS